MRLEFTDFIIESDSHNFTIYRKVVVTGESTRGRKAKDENIGKERLDVVGHYYDLPAACSGLLRERLNDAERVTVNEIKNICDQTVEQIRAVFTTVGALVESGQRKHDPDGMTLEDPEFAEDHYSIMGDDLEDDDV